MALNGSFSGQIRDGYKIRVDWSATQSIDNNTSVVTAKLYFINDWSINISGRTDNTVAIAGSTFTLSSPAYTTTGTHYIGSVSKTLYHANDGTIGVVNLSAVFYIRATISGVYYNSINASGSIQLNTIPRATKPTFSASSVDMGSAVTITLNRASSSFTHSLSYSFEGTSGSIGSNITTSKSWTIPDLASRIPNKAFGTCVVTCTTYNGSTIIGTSSSNLTINVPNSVIPTTSITISEAVADVKNKLGVYVKDLSKLNIEVIGKGAKGSTISSYSVNANGLTYNSAEFTTDTLKLSGTMTISASVTDSRGRTGQASISVDVKDYSKPYITTFKVERTDGNKVSVAMKGGITNLTGNNASYSLEYKKKTDSDYTNANISNSAKTIDTSIELDDIDSNYQYDFRFTITDEFYSTIATFDINTAFVLIDYNANGKSFAFGKVSEQADMIESDIPFMSYQRMLVGTIEDLKKTYISNQWIGFYNANGKRVGWLGSNDTNNLYFNCDSGDNIYLYGKAVNLKSGLSKNQNTLAFDASGSLSLTGGLGINSSYGCMTSNEITIKTANAGIWFNYRTATGGASPTTYNFGDGNKGYATIYCKTLSQTSDRKVKTEIEEISKAYDFIMALEPVMFEFKDSERHRKHMGFIAQDVAQIAKDVEIGDLSLYQASVIDDENEDKPQLYFDDDVPDEKLSWSLNYSEFIAPLIKVVQNQQKTIDALTKRVEMLEQNLKAEEIND